jgi:hypothetical protein
MLRSVVMLLTSSLCVSASSLTLNFEDFPDSTILTTQCSGVTFSNAIILTAGISLNEFKFPRAPERMSSRITAARCQSVLQRFSGHFTYAEPLTLQGFDASNSDASNSMVAAVSSGFFDNEALSGDAGKIYQELDQLRKDGVRQMTHMEEHFEIAKTTLFGEGAPGTTNGRCKYKLRGDGPTRDDPQPIEVNDDMNTASKTAERQIAENEVSVIGHYLTNCDFAIFVSARSQRMQPELLKLRS